VAGSSFIVDKLAIRVLTFGIDIQLNVKGPKTLRESFQTHLLKAMLAGENKYHTEGLGPQEAEKGVTFLSFPPILYIQLKRFEYNPKDKRLVKVTY
jgi:ubiquitin carboxyl-terminal hydrolase 7